MLEIAQWLHTLDPSAWLALAALVLAVVGLARPRAGAPAAGDPRSLARRIETLEEALRRAEAETASLRRRVREVEERLPSHLQRVGLVRFRAFPEVGSDLSFSLALLDARGNGVVLTSLFGREETRVYAKPVHAGKSPYRLAPEEEQALAQALASPPTSPAPR